MLRRLLSLLLLDAALLAAVLLATTGISRLLGFTRADEITIVFCGSKKSLASGLPMASVLFAGQSLGLIVLPLMLFHQIQLMVCAALARRYGAAAASPATVPRACVTLIIAATRGGDRTLSRPTLRILMVLQDK